MAFEYFFFRPMPDKALMCNVLGREEGEMRGMNKFYEGKERRRRKGKKFPCWEKGREVCGRGCTCTQIWTPGGWQDIKKMKVRYLGKGISSPHKLLCTSHVTWLKVIRLRGTTVGLRQCQWWPWWMEECRCQRARWRTEVFPGQMVRVPGSYQTWTGSFNITSG